MNVQDSVVFVTGANRGLGLAFSREALSRGAAKVYAGMRNTDGFDVPGIVPMKLDVTDPASVSAAAASCGDTTLLANNAGIGGIVTGPLDGNMDELSRELFETNFYGVIRVIQAFAPVLARNGDGARRASSSVRPSSCVPRFPAPRRPPASCRPGAPRTPPRS